MAEIRRILCATDFSEAAERAFELATSLARSLGASVHLVHVHSLAAHSIPEGPLMLRRADMKPVHESLERALAHAAAAVRGVEVTTQLVDGAPHEAITRLADELPAELIVMGTEGRTGVDRFLVRSVAERVVRTSRVPVLTARLPRHFEARVP